MSYTQTHPCDDYELYEGEQDTATTDECVCGHAFDDHDDSGGMFRPCMECPQND